MLRNSLTHTHSGRNLLGEIKNFDAIGNNHNTAVNTSRPKKQRVKRSLDKKYKDKENKLSTTKINSNEPNNQGNYQVFNEAAN